MNKRNQYLVGGITAFLIGLIIYTITNYSLSSFVSRLGFSLIFQGGLFTLLGFIVAKKDNSISAKPVLITVLICLALNIILFLTIGRTILGYVSILFVWLIGCAYLLITIFKNQKAVKM